MYNTEEEFEMEVAPVKTWLETVTTKDYNPWAHVDLVNALFDWATPNSNADPYAWYTEIEDMVFYLSPHDLNYLLLDVVQGQYDDILDDETLDRAAMALELADPDVLMLTDINHMVQAGFLGKVRY